MAFNVVGEHKASDIKVVCTRLKTREVDVHRLKKGSSKCFISVKIPNDVSVLDTAICIQLLGTQPRDLTARIVGIISD